MTATPPSASPAPRPQEIAEFLRLLYPDEMHEEAALRDDYALVIWDRPGGTSWIGDSEALAAANRVAARALDGDAYYHVCLHSRELLGEERRNARGCASSATAAPGLWADIDHAGGDHKRETLARDLGEILEVLKGFPLAPTAVVDTGGGVHAYWLFPDPITLRTEADRARVHDGARRLQMALRDLFARRELEGVDFAHDLARVLRLPGTVSYKYHRLVTLLPGERPRYSFDELERVLPELPAEPALPLGKVAHRPVQAATFTLDRDARPPQRLVDSIVMGIADVTLQQTWRRERKVYSGRGPRAGCLKDSSASSYTMALVMRMLSIGEWTDQELADAIVSWRAMHGELVKGGRLMSDEELARRVSLTIQKARSSTGLTAPETVESAGAPGDEGYEDPVAEIAREELAQRAAQRPDTEPVEVTDEDERSRVLARISEAIGTPVLRVEREVVAAGAGGIYTLVLPPPRKDDPELRVEIGPVRSLLQPHEVRAQVLDGTGRLIARVKATAWDPIALAIREVAVEPHDSETIQTVYTEMLRDYLTRNLAESTSSTLGGSSSSRRPVILPQSRRCAIKSSHLAEWAAMRPGLEQRTAAGWSRVLRIVGLGRSQTVRVDGKEDRRFVLRSTVDELGIEIEEAAVTEEEGDRDDG